jgi:hypothetical protein
MDYHFLYNNMLVAFRVPLPSDAANDADQRVKKTLSGLPHFFAASPSSISPAASK